MSTTKKRREVFDVLADVMTSEEWGELLRAPLEHAAAKGSRDIAQKLVGAGADIGNALHAAARGGLEEIVNDLLENGASVAAMDSTGRTPLHVAAGDGTTEIVQLLLLKGADQLAVDNDGCTPLDNAAWKGNVGAVLALLAAGADVNLVYGGVESVVHTAARRGHVGIMRVAIERGADVDAPNADSDTPLHEAAFCDKVEAINVLVEAGANIEARDDEDCTPLHRAVSVPALEASLAFLKHGADVNAQSRGQYTALHFAAGEAGKQGAAEVVDLLLRSGADETSLNDEGKAAADFIACFVGWGQLVEDVDRVRDLLATAPVDRAWRRRGYLLLCRAHPDRVQQMQHINAVHAGVAGTTRGGAGELENIEGNDCRSAGEGSPMADWCGGDWAVAVARVLGLQEEGIFRTIVGYL